VAAPWSRLLRWACASLAAGLLLACSGSEQAPAPTVTDDVAALQRAVAADTCPSALADVDGEVEDGKPVNAARLLHSAAIPAAARQVGRIHDTQVHTSQGITLRQEGETLYDACRAALEGYADVLERGVLEDMDLVMALDAQRRADAALGAYLVRLEELRPLARRAGHDKEVETPAHDLPAPAAAGR